MGKDEPKHPAKTEWTMVFLCDQVCFGIFYLKDCVITVTNVQKERLEEREGAEKLFKFL